MDFKISIMADKCTDIATLEEMSMFCRWEENGVPVEHFLEIIHLKKADAECIFSARVDCLKEKNLQVSKIVGMGFDGAATFSGKKLESRLDSRMLHRMHCLYTVTAICFNWLVCKQQIQRQE